MKTIIFSIYDSIRTESQNLKYYINIIDGKIKVYEAIAEDGDYDPGWILNAGYILIDEYE